MKKQRTLISFLIFGFFTIQIYGQSDYSKNIDQAKLESILKKCAEYCERVKNIALFYVCQEEIKDKTNFYRIGHTIGITPYGNTALVSGGSLNLNNTRISSYLYDYQLINKEGELQEQRTLLKKNNRKKNIKSVKLETRFNAKYPVYGPVGFLSRYWQNYFSYEIIRHESLGEIQTTIIDATPKPNNTENRIFAKLWINEKDSSILKIEWRSGSIYDYDGKNIASMSGEFRTVMMLSVTYGFEKNGVRFPSQQHVEEFIVSESGERYLRNEIITNFNNYKFFLVGSEIKY